MLAAIWAAPTVLIDHAAALWSRYWREHGWDRAYRGPYWC
jgi:hypothetical protein